MRIAIAKPDWGFAGGFELVLRELAGRLGEGGHDVRWLHVDARNLPSRPFGIEVPEELTQRAPEFVRYIAMIEAFRRLDTRNADVVITAQPPSFAVDHPHQLSVFYHHLRLYYDLSDVAVRAGLVEPDSHAIAQEHIRRIDDHFLGAVPAILAGSERVQDRLARFNGRTDGVSVLHAGRGLGGPMPTSAPVDSYDGGPVCVSRHEFPKRTELFVHAMKHLAFGPGRSAASAALIGTSIGAGGRLGYVQALDRRLTALGTGALQEASEPLWCSSPIWQAPVEESDPASNVRFTGWVDDDDLELAYRRALCVIAPAYDEDYGLTVIEAMAFGKPAIVCTDGGNLTTFVRDGENGLVVEPTAHALADAISRLRDDRPLCARLGAAARETAAAFTWERAMTELGDGLDRARSGR